MIICILMCSWLLACSGITPMEGHKEDDAKPVVPVIIVNNDRPDYMTGDAVESGMTAEDEDDREQEDEFIYDEINKIYSKESSSPDEISLVFAGDICFYDDYANMGVYRQQSDGIYGCIDETLMKEMTGADIFMLNNEFAYSDRGAPIEGKQYAFRSKPGNVSILNDMGVDIVSLANNHAYDWGPDALIDSIDTLNGAKVPFVGAGKDLDEAMKPVYFRINGLTIAYVSATQIERTANPDTKEATATSPGVLRTLDPTAFLKVISLAKENSDLTIVYVHWGSENTDLVEQSQRDLARKYVEAGAGLIIGDHPHCLQGIDYIGDVPVFYSLGNYWFNSKTVDTGLLKVILDKDASIRECRFIPAIQKGCKTRYAGNEESVRILSYLQGISNHAVIDTSSGRIERSETDHNIQNGVNTSPSRKIEEPLDSIDLNGILLTGQTEEGTLDANEEHGE